MEKEVIHNTINLSGVIISGNEEKKIADCIDTLAFCDEVIVVDSSTDKTGDIAKRMGATIIKITTDDFSAMRNLGLSKALGNWVLYIDADERVSRKLADEILFTINNSPNEYYKIPRQDVYFKQTVWPRIEYMERLFKKNALISWKGKLHESPMVTGSVGVLQNTLLHYTHRDIESMLSKTIKWSQVEADLRMQAHHPKMTWWRFPRVMASSFFNSYIIRGGYKAGIGGLIESMYQSFSTFITYARLWEMQNQKKK